MIYFILLSTLLVLALGSPRISNVPRLDGRIVGGIATTIEEYPYQLSLLYYGRHICGASIISSKYAVTAAHCTHGSSVSHLTLRAGSSIRNSGGVIIAISNIYENPLFDVYSIDYDICILELTSEINFDVTMQPVALPSLNQNIASGSLAVCTGWGTLTEGGLLPNILQVVNIPIVSNSECNIAYDTGITDRMMCAGFQGIEGSDACQGDSGGPLVANGQLIGIVSWGYGCARPQYPGVYANVTSLRSYITNIAAL